MTLQRFDFDHFAGVLVLLGEVIQQPLALVRTREPFVVLGQAEGAQQQRLDTVLDAVMRMLAGIEVGRQAGRLLYRDVLADGGSRLILWLHCFSRFRGGTLPTLAVKNGKPHLVLAGVGLVSCGHPSEMEPHHHRLAFVDFFNMPSRVEIGF